MRGNVKFMIVVLAITIVSVALVSPSVGIDTTQMYAIIAALTVVIVGMIWIASRTKDYRYYEYTRGGNNMERKTILGVAMIAMSFVLVSILVSAPFTVSEARLTSIVIDGNAVIEDVVNISVDVDTILGSTTGKTYDGNVTFLGSSDGIFTTFDLYYYDGHDVTQLTYENTSMMLGSMYGNKIVWSNNWDIYMKDIDTNNTSNLSIGSVYYENNPLIWGDNVIFTRSYGSYDGLVWLDTLTNIETNISIAGGDVYYADIYENKVVYSWFDGIDYYIYAAYLNDPETFTNPLYIGVGNSPSIWGNDVAYEAFDGYKTYIEYINLFSRDRDTLYPVGLNDYYYTPIVYDGIVTFEFSNTTSYDKIGLVRITNDAFGMTVYEISNDVGDLYITDFSHNIIIAEIFDPVEGKYNVVKYEIVQIVEGDDIIPDIDDVVTVYNYDWIYFTILIFSALIAVAVFYYSEYIMDY